MQFTLCLFVVCLFGFVLFLDLGLQFMFVFSWWYSVIAFLFLVLDLIALGFLVDLLVCWVIWLFVFRFDCLVWRFVVCLETRVDCNVVNLFGFCFVLVVGLLCW